MNNIQIFQEIETEIQKKFNAIYQYESCLIQGKLEEIWNILSDNSKLVLIAPNNECFLPININNIKIGQINDLKLNINDNVKSKDELCKTNTFIINNLLGGYLSKKPKKLDDENKGNDQAKIKITQTINPEILRKQKLFASKKYYTKKELKKKINDVFQSKRRASIKNFSDYQMNKINLMNENNQSGKPFILNESKDNEYSAKKKKKYIEYEDLYFEDEMFIPESSSFPNEKEEDFLLKLKFIEENDYNDDIDDYDVRYCSINYKNNNEGQLYTKYYKNQKNDNSEKNLPNLLDNLYIEEKEEEGKNICYVHDTNINTSLKSYITKKSNNNMNNSLNEKNTKIISYMSINLLVKKITLENFRNKYSFIYKCFIEQFRYFIPINNLVNKIFSAFNYYHENMKLDCTELILFLNTLIYENLEIIKVIMKVNYIQNIIKIQKMIIVKKTYRIY